MEQNFNQYHSLSELYTVLMSETPDTIKVINNTVGLPIDKLEVFGQKCKEFCEINHFPINIVEAESYEDYKFSCTLDNGKIYTSRLSNCEYSLMVISAHFVLEFALGEYYDKMAKTDEYTLYTRSGRTSGYNTDWREVDYYSNFNCHLFPFSNNVLVPTAEKHKVYLLNENEINENINYYTGILNNLKKGIFPNDRNYFVSDIIPLATHCESELRDWKNRLNYTIKQGNCTSYNDKLYLEHIAFLSKDIERKEVA